MSNFSASLKVVLSYGTPSGGTIAPPALSVVAPFKASGAGTVDVPDATAQGTEIAIPFGGAGEATAVLVKNGNNQAMGVVFNDAANPSFDLPPGGVVMIAADEVPGGTPLTKLELKTTALQVGEGVLEYWVFGDPEPDP